MAVTVSRPFEHWPTSSMSDCSCRSRTIRSRATGSSSTTSAGFFPPASCDLRPWCLDSRRPGVEGNAESTPGSRRR